jgi:hypothetical protein
VDVRGRMGLGATLSWAVGVLAYCERQNLEPVLRFGNPLYASAPGEDWLDRYFIRKPVLRRGIERGELAPEQYLTAGTTLMRRLRPAFDSLTLVQSCELFLNALDFRGELMEQVNRFCREHDVGANTVAVHYRGTDKAIEANLPSMDEVFEVAKRALDLGQSNLFVASDEPKFLEAITRYFGRSRVVDLGCRQIYSGRPAHYESADNDEKAREALLTMLVLSRAGTMVRLRSHLSAWSSILNPAMPVITLGAMRAGDQFRYPEHLFDTATPLTIESSTS